MIIGVISDTHGVLSPEAVSAFKGVDHIIHAGDIDHPDVLNALTHIAPVTAVRGNMDNGHWALKLPVSDLIGFHGVNFYIIHNLDGLDLDPIAAGIQIVISGHTHRSETKTVGGVLYLNPGSASYARHGGPLSVGRIELSADGVYSQIIKLENG